MNTKNNPYVKKLMMVADAYIEQAAALEAQRQKIMSQPFTKDYIEKELAPIAAKISANRSKAAKDVSSIVDDYVKAVDKWALPGLGDASTDFALLSNPLIVLSSEDVKELGRKHADNYTMQKALREYALVHKLTFKPAATPEDKKKSFAFLADVVRNMVRDGTDSYSGRRIADTAARDRLLSSCDDTIGDGHELN